MSSKSQRTLGTQSRVSSHIKTQILARWFLLNVVKDTIIPERAAKRAAPRHSGLFGSCRATPDNGGTTQTNTPASSTGNQERSLLINQSLPNGFHLLHEYPTRTTLCHAALHFFTCLCPFSELLKWFTDRRVPFLDLRGLNWVWRALRWKNEQTVLFRELKTDACISSRETQCSFQELLRQQWETSDITRKGEWLRPNMA